VLVFAISVKKPEREGEREEGREFGFALVSVGVDGMDKKCSPFYLSLSLSFSVAVCNYYDGTKITERRT